ncbi:Putative nuclease [Frankliniella fusca]|uniref:Nuclease n=1 Tax=Frankliniella fusca TaxID=407009 RepID=A0AAE1GYT4_9NEOP|nr:Putative nuclease [Frankliniella fusca]
MRMEIRNVVNPFNVSDTLFKNTFRLDKRLARQLVVELQPFLHSDEDPLAVPNTIKVLSVLHFYGHGGYQATVGSNWLHCLSRSTVSRYIEDVTNALNSREIQERWIRFPRSRQERDLLRERHQVEFQIPGTIGFIDGTEVATVCPPQDMNPQGFWTRKHHYALNCQIACDSNLVILSVNARNPGSNHDAFIWANSALRRRMRDCFNEDQNSWLLGDSAYPREPWLLTPIVGAPPGSPEEYYTELHCKARNCVERCYGVLKGRFRCLLKDRVLHYRPAKAGRIVKACCVLHNMCRMGGLPHDDIAINEEEEDGIPWVPNEFEALLQEAEEEADHEQLVQVANDVQRAGIAVRQRVIDFLQIQRQ